MVRCEKNYISGTFSLSLADGIDMEFDAKGNLTSISAPANYSLSPTLLKAIVPGKLYNLLVHNGFKSSIESVSRSKNGYRLYTADPVFEEVCYDSSGVLTPDCGPLMPRTSSTDSGSFLITYIHSNSLSSCAATP